MKRYLLALLLLPLATQAQRLSLAGLHCEYRSNPSGVENRQPALSWEISGTQQNLRQTAYRILVADNPDMLKRNVGNMWDSQKVTDSTSQQLRYAGKPLKPGTKYWWKVQVWDNHGASASGGATWQMGLFTPQDWTGARWIAYEVIADTSIIAPHVHLNGKKSWGARRNVLPMFRKEFQVTKSVKSATAFICGLGHMDLHINGASVGGNFLEPGWTDYAKEAQYVSYDVRSQLKPGKNALGVMLGNGFYYIPGQRYRKMTGAYGLPKMIMRLAITYEDGTSEDIISDASWRCAPSPIVYSSIYGGEDYDANLEQRSWDKPSFDDRSWRAVELTTGPQLVAQMAEPLKQLQSFKPLRSWTLRPGVQVYDLGQNFSGIPYVSVSGHRGDTVRIAPAELLKDDSSANQAASGAPCYFTYILRGDEKEQWTPQFSYYGFRYVEVQCLPAVSGGSRPMVKDVGGHHIRNAADSAGSFACSNKLFNQTYNLINWAIKSNMASVFTDCPHREKLGWLEETHLMGASVHYNFDVAAMFRKVIRDMRNAQYEDGKVPEISPEFTQFTPPFDESPEWGSASVILPWYHYRWYGDLHTLRESYSMMQRYTEYLRRKSNGNILTHGLGDWFDIGPDKSGFSQMTKTGITATATYYYDLHIMSQVARLLDKPSDALHYDSLAREVKQSFNQRFYNTQLQQYDSASQTANAMALYMGLAEQADRPAVLNALVKDIRGRNNALTAGDVGYRYVLRALSDEGRSDVVFDMNYRDDVPGYGYQLKHGATALTESWQAYPSVSNNHFMLGHLMEWFYGGLAGIGQAPGSVGYKHIEIKPQPVGDVAWVEGRFHSPYGWITSKWSKKGQHFELQLEVPGNSYATVHLPVPASAKVTQDGKRIAANVVQVGSGKYVFKADL